MEANPKTIANDPPHTIAADEQGHAAVVKAKQPSDYEVLTQQVQDSKIKGGKGIRALEEAGKLKRGGDESAAIQHLRSFMSANRVRPALKKK